MAINRFNESRFKCFWVVKQPFEHLRKMSDQSLRDKQLLVWYFESLVKIKYSSFIKALQVFRFVCFELTTYNGC